MGRIDISFETVKQKTNQLREELETGLTGDIITRYENLAKGLEESDSKGMDAIKEAIKREETMIKGVNGFMVELLNFIQESADAFEHVDTNHEEVLKQLI